ncbi:NACHT domain-containing NTPase [Coleofasciculus sp. FACHB-SPT9]|uniref:NACHT domain-containing protein n=1 Tax=Cyanophyceae TaxID=3028117 RepID=UPI001689CD69|nr:NACHT domain-containing NTPase [Coleofasciculus sp. FACHB-SPT9]MBD1889321.1 NACHT domain-containing NTPase [Coleofasciculus sp. FACHB-SPT9]
MDSLPEAFLNQLANDYDLSPEQGAAFVRRFSSNKQDLDIANSLNISSGAFRTRMTGVYRKFNFCAKGPGKFYKLRDFLTKKYQNDYLHSTDNTVATNKDIDALVQEVREKIKPSIQECCGKMRVLDMEQAIGLNDIYTDVNILEKITGRRRLKISELLQDFDPEKEDFIRCGLGKVKGRITGLDAVNRHSKLMVLGKPGAGKTTFLKYLAIQCAFGNFYSNKIPFFVTLKRFSEIDKKPTLLDFISQEFAKDSVTPIQLSNVLKQGRMLILLDGLDEVKEEDSEWVLGQIKDFSAQHRTNQFLLTCRIAAHEYTFEQFVEVEIADFDDQQIEAFAKKWFCQEALDLPNRFIQQLEANQSIKELATNPLLLTLLCLEFEDSGDFPHSRAELYDRAIQTLLRKWDSKRGIIRNEIYKKLSVGHKEGLLSKIAWTTFERKDYFFKQRDIERYIRDYIRNLCKDPTELDSLQVDSETILKSMEAQHGLLVERARGIYSFSHLTFQEYFTAKKIVESPASQAFNQLEKLSNYVNEKRWSEVFLLTIALLSDASDLLLLMKTKIDQLVASDQVIQQFLFWANQKALLVKTAYKPAKVRSFYFMLDNGFLMNKDFISNSPSSFITIYKSIDIIAQKGFGFDKNYKNLEDIEHDLVYDYELSQIYLTGLAHVSIFTMFKEQAEAVDFSKIYESDHFQKLRRSLLSAIVCAERTSLELEIKSSLQRLKAQLPKLNDNEKDKKTYQEWWCINGQDWINQVRAIITKYRNLGHDWQFTLPQIDLLSQYFSANALLVNCLKSDCYLSLEVRQEIENTLLLPKVEIENLSNN